MIVFRKVKAGEYQAMSTAPGWDAIPIGYIAKIDGRDLGYRVLWRAEVGDPPTSVLYCETLRDAKRSVLERAS